MLNWAMRVAKWIPVMLAAAALAASGLTQDRSAPLDPIAGFELRLLDKKFPVQITAGGKTEEHGAPVWVFMPQAGLAQAPLDDITQPADLDGGTTLLPAPPDGFGLRALKLPIRESFILADGWQAIVEIPVFVYFRRVEVKVQSLDAARNSSSGVVPGSDQKAPPTLAPAWEAEAELNQLRSELAEVHRQFSAIVPSLDGCPAKVRLKNLVQQLSETAEANGIRDGYGPDGSMITP
jgi:hypothetical protein